PKATAAVSGRIGLPDPHVSPSQQILLAPKEYDGHLEWKDPTRYSQKSLGACRGLFLGRKEQKEGRIWLPGIQKSRYFQGSREVDQGRRHRRGRHFIGQHQPQASLGNL